MNDKLCPICKRSLEPKQDLFICTYCGEEYTFENGILDYNTPLPQNEHSRSTVPDPHPPRRRRRQDRYTGNLLNNLPSLDD